MVVVENLAVGGMDVVVRGTVGEVVAVLVNGSKQLGEEEQKEELGVVEICAQGFCYYYCYSSADVVVAVS